MVYLFHVPLCGYSQMSVRFFIFCLNIINHAWISWGSEQSIECGGSGVSFWGWVIKGNEVFALFAEILASIALRCHLRDLTTLRSHVVWLKPHAEVECRHFDWKCHWAQTFSHFHQGIRHVSEATLDPAGQPIYQMSTSNFRWE